jgi:FkbM family methyltransferase
MVMAPIVLFVYSRPWHTQQTLMALAANHLADQSELIVFADGPKHNAMPEEIAKIKEVRDLVKEQLWCKTVTIYESNCNKGLADSIIEGVTKVVNKYGKVIVLEDDIVTSPGFLKYMNDALSLYENEDKVLHISGYMFPVNRRLPETFFYNTTSCWGWGTWARAWKYFDNDAKKLAELIYRKNLIKKFNIHNSYPFYSQLEDNSSGRLNTWAVKWYASFFLMNGFSLHPYPSLTNNIGHDNSGENCINNNFFNWDKLSTQINVKKIPIKESLNAISAMVKFNKNLSGIRKYFVERLTFYFKRQVIIILKRLKLTRFISKNNANEIRLLREKKRISKIPRFIEGYFSFNNTHIKFIDSASFLFMYNEIIEKQIYKFNISSDKPFIIDAGANIGLSIIYFKQLYPSATILGFEPDPQAFESLKFNINQFGFSDVEILEKGVWNCATTLSFFAEGADGGRVAIKTDKVKIREIQTVRLKEYLNKHVDFLKIDIEGSETTVLKDCADALNNVDRIFVEYHSFIEEQQDLKDLLQILSKAGFRYIIQHVGVFSPTPFVKVFSYLNIDNQLNIFAYRN